VRPRSGASFVLLLTAAVALAQEPDVTASASSTSPDSTDAGSSASVDWAPGGTLVHRVDAFVTRADLRAGVLLSDREAPRVRFSHGLHAQAGVQCAQCHHTGTPEQGKAQACAECHKGAAGVETMHAACITCHRDRGAGPVTCNDCHRERDAGIAGLIRFDLYDLLRGPGFIAAWIVFALGCLCRIGQYVRLTVLARRTEVAGGGRGDGRADRDFLGKGRSVLGRLLLGIKLRMRNTILGSNPVMTVVSLSFHTLLLLAPLLLPAHNTLFDLTFRVSLPALPERLVDWFTVFLLGAGGFFLLRRLLIPRVRALTTARDWLILGMVMAPFATAYLAYHQILDYRTVLATHMALGELVIAAIPFTAIGHMPFILFARFFTSGEYAWKPGNRRWR
jgi:hypothetical protein